MAILSPVDAENQRPENFRVNRSPFDDLELNGLDKGNSRYLNLVEASWAGFEASLTMPTVI